MLKQRNEQVQLAAKSLDILVCVIAFYAAYALRSSQLIPINLRMGIDPIESLMWLLGTGVAAHLVIYPSVGFYESLRLKSVRDIFTMIFKASVIEFFVMGTMVFLVQAKTTSRSFFGLFLFLNYFLVLVEKLGVRFLLSSVRRRGYNFRQLLIVGSGENAKRLIQSLKRHSHWGFVPFGVLIPASEGSSVATHDLEGVPVLGTLGDLESLVIGRTIDEVIFAMDRIDTIELSEPMQLCDRLGISTRVSLGMFNLPNRKIVFTRVEEIPLVTFYTTLRTPVEEFLKRTIDIAIALVGLFIAVLISPWIYFKIQQESPGPILFKQRRVGENGRIFSCYKFRTMSLDAEARKQELRSKNQMAGPIFKIDHDPRVFPFGAFMRKTSIDEFPQFFNILRGDMSVVGTRPPTPDEVKIYETSYRKRLSVRPGLTGLWQVSGRNEIKNFEDVLKLDVEYIERWSIGLDLQIILKTVWVTLFRKGAY